MLSFDEALKRTLSAALPFGAEAVPLAAAAGRVLAEAVVADLDLPPFETTAMDGWAVRARDVPAAPAVLRVAGRLGAGALPRGPLEPGTALKVMTGAPMPEGADAVVPVEKSELLDDARVRLDEAPRAAAHVRRRGEVVAAGQALLSPGRKLSAADVALAAAAGRETLRVARRARAIVLVTGDEIVPPGCRPGPGQIRNTNEPLLLGALHRLGADGESAGTVDDDAKRLEKALRGAFERKPDYLLTTGGISMGDYDLVGEMLARLKAVILFHKVAIRPAKPILVARRGDTLVVALPGNPVSAAVGFDFFLRPAWRKSNGLAPPLPAPVRARLVAAVRNDGPRVAFLPAELGDDGSRRVVRPVPTQGSHDAKSHALSNAYLFLQPKSALRKGADADVFPATDETTLG